MTSKLLQLYLKSMDQGRIVFVGLLIALIFTANFPQAAYAGGLSWLPTFNTEENKYTLQPLSAVDLLTQRITETDPVPSLPAVAPKSEGWSPVASPQFPNAQPPLRTLSAVRTMIVTSTAYSSTVDQCDSTPCIAADGFNVCANAQENVVAANFLKFGTKIKIPELYGDKVFTVHDRMHPRFDNRVDLWKLSRESALQYGKRTIKIEILG